MKVLDVNPFAEGIEHNIVMLRRINEEMSTINQTVEGLVAMGDSLKGEGGNAIRAFYQECHVPLQQFFKTFNERFISVLQNMDAALTSLEANPAGYIKQSFLEGEAEEGLKEIKQLTESLTSESNGIMDQVADIVSLPHLDDSDVQEGIQNARIKRNKTVTDLNTFDSEQKTALVTIESDLLRMELWISEIEKMIKDNLTVIDFQSNVWAGNFNTNPLRTELQNRAAQMNHVHGNNDAEKTGNVFSEMTNLAMLRGMMTLSGTMKNASNVTNNTVGSEKVSAAKSENTEGEVGSGTIEWQSSNGQHAVRKGKAFDHEAAGIEVDTVKLYGYEVNYALKDGNFMILEDNPDLYYYTQSAEQGHFNYYAGKTAQGAANLVGTGGVFKVLGKIPGATKIADKLNEKSPHTGEIGKGIASYELQKRIPVWGQIIGTSVPEVGSKQVILYISEDGEEWRRRVSFKINKDEVTHKKWEVK